MTNIFVPSLLIATSLGLVSWAATEKLCEKLAVDISNALDRLY